ncbi:diguanylate cyclase (GGDEF)-like protein [Pseudorhizobium tarimense]|uniref:diguanylate cyclase n=1 Tax=Pseudorhizobium tarimense TaxID=1079109 RepID=A0ABV2H2L5_9HYPH|nr:GGDEF domain-containing protein [Pseudorhizobium tarimense]MCJ8518215.1 GGDEF domain-containing protein [Pseudorhizobium tarimense]
MNGTNFFLGMNFLIALSFCVVFLVVSTRSRSKSAVRWIAAGFAVASFSTLCELAVAHTDWVRFSAIAAFVSVLGGLQLLRIGIARLYEDRISLPDQVMFFLFWVIVDLLIYDLPRGTLLHSFAYQTPFAILGFNGARSVMRSKRRLPVDYALCLLLTFTGLHFLGKAWLAAAVGAGTTAKDYIHTNYAVISQSATGIMVVTVGLMLLAVLVLEIMADERSKSETDLLSALLNRRGFEQQLVRCIGRHHQGSHTLIMCDLDHFKSINDTYGHYCGDRVIEAFGQLLTEQAPKGAVVGRLGGEEFGLFLPRMSLEAAIPLANAIRTMMATLAVPGLPREFRANASFGVAPWNDRSTLQQNMQQADAALYEAKKAGRNCVRWVVREPIEASVAAQ